MSERAFQGDMLAPDHPEYNEARKLFNAMIDRHPALIARCQTASDVAYAVRLARSRGLDISVRAGGHGVAGFAVCDGGLVIDLRAMKRMRVDPALSTAVAEAGLTWGEFDHATGLHGLATTGGRVSSTGIAGLTLGSGSGWLQRKHGFTPDNLIAAEMVTADANRIRTSADQHPELFWALRGGGGNFGVVTSFTYQLHPVEPRVLGGLLYYPAEAGPDVVRAWRDYMNEAPDEVGSALLCIASLQRQDLPALVGRPAIGIFVAWFGALADGANALRPLREIDGIAADFVKPAPYSELQQLLDPVALPGRHQYWKSEELVALSESAIETCLDQTMRAPSPYSLVILEAKGGACERVPTDATPLSRGATYDYQATSIWEGSADSERHIAWAKETAQAMAPFSQPGIALNFTSDVGDSRVRSTYGPEKYRRLVAVKDEWDPDNVFQSNQNIRPSQAPARATPTAVALSDNH